MSKKSRFALVSVAVVALTTAMTFRVTAQAPPPAGTPTDMLGHIMEMIGQGRIDEAVSLMDGLKSNADLKQDVTAQLVHLRDEQSPYHGYEIAATQRFTGEFQRIDVVANYDQQPVLLRFSFYRPLGNEGKWTVLYCHVHTNILEILDLLKDSPVDYFAGRATRR